MDSTLHTMIAAQHIQDRIAEATAARLPRSVKPRRAWPRWARRRTPVRARRARVLTP